MGRHTQWVAHVSLATGHVILTISQRLTDLPIPLSSTWSIGKAQSRAPCILLNSPRGFCARLFMRGPIFLGKVLGSKLLLHLQFLTPETR